MDDAKKILTIVTQEQELNAERHQNLMVLFVREQELNAGRYQELKSSVEGIGRTMVTRIEFEKAFSSTNFLDEP